MSSLQEKLEYCKICKLSNRTLDKGIVCSLTNEKPNFDNICENFVIDKNLEQKEIIKKQEIILDTASIGKRFLNYVIDSIGIFFFSTFFVILFSIFELLRVLFYFLVSGKLGNVIFEILIVFFYYVLFESIFGYTPGKIFTKTKVVNLKNKKANFHTILLRTLLRLIPFEALSFFGKLNIGWHDKLSGTRVVNDENPKRILGTSLIMGVIVFIVSVFFVLKIIGTSIYKDTEESVPFTIYYHGVLIECTENWIVNKVEVEPNLIYQINGRKKGVSADNFSLLIITRPIDLYMWLENTENELRKSKGFNNIYFGKQKYSKFKNETSLSVKYSYKVMNIRMFGEVMMFNKNNNAVMFVKESDSKKNLLNNFIKIKNSIKIDKNNNLQF